MAESIPVGTPRFFLAMHQDGSARFAQLGRAKAIRVKARAPAAGQTVHLTLVEADGTAWGPVPETFDRLDRHAPVARRLEALVRRETSARLSRALEPLDRADARSRRPGRSPESRSARTRADFAAARADGFGQFNRSSLDIARVELIF